MKRNLTRLLPERIRFPIRMYREWYCGEPELRFVGLLCNRSEAFVDVGANDGVYTFFARRYCAHVHAIEANPQLSTILRRRFRQSVTVHSIAVSDKAGLATFYIPVGRHGEVWTRGSLNDDANPGMKLRCVAVECRRIDDLGLRNVGLMKIDVEGHELSVLRGSAQILRAERPNVIIEIENRHHHGECQTVFAFLSGLDYHGFFITGRSVHAVEDFSVSEHQRPEHEKQPGEKRQDRYVNNFIFLPHSKLDLLGPLRAAVEA